MRPSARFPSPLQFGFDSRAPEPYVVDAGTYMAENNPTSPGAALPPKPAEASKVQPKKETVRINLPPKPTSAPTIKLPTLAPGTAPPVAAASAAAPVAATTTAAPPPPSSKAAPPPPTPPPAGAPARMSSTVPKQPAAAPAAAPAPRPAAAGVSGLDKG